MTARTPSPGRAPRAAGPPTARRGLRILVAAWLLAAVLASPALAQPDGNEADGPPVASEESEGSAARNGGQGAGEEGERDGAGSAGEEGTGQEGTPEEVDEDAPRAPLEAEEAERPDRFDVVGDQLVATLNEGVAWRRPLPPEGGPSGEPTLIDGDLWLPRGLYLLALDPATGEVRTRVALPAPATRVADRNGPTAVVEHEDGTEETVAIRDGEVEGPVRFGAHPEAFEWLRAEAEALGAEAAQLDPTNPWALLRAARAADDDARAEELRADAIEAAGPLPFFEKASLALALDRPGAREEADGLMDAALADMAERGYDPRLLTEHALREAYGLPHQAVRDALEDDDLDAAERWAQWLWRTATPTQPETVRTLHELADGLDARGDDDAAELWRDRAVTMDRGGIGRMMDRAALSLGRFGWAAVGAVLAAAALLYLTLWAKYLRPQAFHRRQRHERGERTRPTGKLLAIRHFSTTEKLVLVLVLVTAACLAGLTAWGSDATDLPPAFGSGTLASAPAWEALQELPDNADADFARGYAAQVRGDEDAAEQWLRDAGDHASALNNLGALTGDESLYQRALRFSPRLPEARFNLGRRANPSPFHEAYRPATPLLSAPTPTELALAAGGDWQTAVGDVLVQPWRALPDARPDAWPAWVWWLVLLVFAVILIGAVAMVFRPRPRVSRNAPRSWGYHVLAVLVPGTGQADEVYGLLLLLPWSILGLDLIWRIVEGTSPLGLGLGLQITALALLYLINFVTYAIELASYRRRMRLLREEQPELARSLGLPPLPRRRTATEA